MLPLPSSSSSRRNRTYFPSLPPAHNLSSSQQVLQTLRSRTRLTNLAVFLLLLCLSGSLILNLNYLVLPSNPTIKSSSSITRYGGGGGRWINKGWDNLITPIQLKSNIPLSIETTIERDSRYNELNHLIMVPGHAIWLGHDINKINENDDWILEPMQKGGSVKTYVKHIIRGTEELRKDNKALLVFSGGATRQPPSPPLPEALSYHNLAHALDLLPSTAIPIEKGEVKPPLSLNLRAATEEFALDSYQNLLFSIARFKEVTGRYPERITVVGYGMKRRRFTNLHLSALSFPLSNFTYIGIDDEGDTSAHYSGELKYGFKPFLKSPTGCQQPLSLKKLYRNPFFKIHPYHISNPELIDLFEWCPPIQKQYEVDDGRDNLDDYENTYGLSFGGPLPWNRQGEKSNDIAWDRERY